MLSNYHITSLRKIVIFLFFFIISSCVYFNTFYNAEESFKKAKQIINLQDYRETGLPIEAKNLLDEAIINSKIVLQEYPNSKYVEDAYYIISVSMLFKDDFEGSKEYFLTLLEKYPNSKYYIESKLWISLCELKLGHIEEARILLPNIIKENFNPSKYEKFIYYQILSEFSIVQQEIESVYQHLNSSLKYSSSDKQRINIYNKLIRVSEEFEDYNNLVLYLDELYDILEDEKERKNIKLVSIDYNKKLKNYSYLISEIESLLDLSSFNDKRLFLTLELGKIYYEMQDHSTAKEIFYNIVSENNKKKETSEAYYFLAKINMDEEFNFDVMKELLEKSKSEKSSSKYGKLSKKMISKIEDLEDTIYEYELSMDTDTTDIISTLRSDSLLFHISESFYFDFNNTDSSFSRYQELIKKFPDSEIYTPKALYALSWIDPSNIYIGDYLEGTWMTIVSSIYPNYSTSNLTEEDFNSRLNPALDLFDKGKYESAYLLMQDILSSDSELKFYNGLINEMFFFNTLEMLENYIEYANQETERINLQATKEKLSSFYYIMNQDIKYLKSKRKLSECSNKIIINSQLDSIYSCFEKINDLRNYYSYDSLKVKINDIIPGSPSSFKRKMKHFDADYNAFNSTFSYIRDNISIDSTYSIDNINDSLLTIINNLIFNLGSIEATTIDEKIDKLDEYLSIYDNLNLPDTMESKRDTIDIRGQRPFKELDLENLDIDKLKLNLTK